jgi:hypothetical protein
LKDILQEGENSLTLEVMMAKTEALQARCSDSVEVTVCEGMKCEDVKQMIKAQ